MEKVISIVFILAVVSAEIYAGCTVRMPCGSGVNDFIQCSGNNCKRIYGESDRFNKVECDGKVTKCFTGTVIGGV